MAVDERAAALNEATKNLTRVTNELQKFNESTGVEIAKIVGKDLKKISDPFVQSFANIPGVQTLGSIGGTLFNKAFAKLKEKREMKHLQDQLGLDKMEFERFKKQSDVLKAEEKAAQELNSAAESILGFSVKLPENFKNTLGVFDKATKGFVMETEKLKELKEKEAELTKQLDKTESGSEEFDKIAQELNNVIQQVDAGERNSEPVENLLNAQLRYLKDQNTSLVELNKVGLDSSNVGKTAADRLGGIENSAAQQVTLAQGGLKSGAAQAEAQNELQRREDRRDTVFGSIANGIQDMKDGIINGLAGLKDKGLLGLGVLAGLVAAPFIAISAFFTQLIKEVKVLDSLTKGGLGRFFGPITRFFKAIGDVFGKAGTGQFLKGDTIKLFGRYADDISLFIGRIKSIFSPLMKAAKGSASFMSGFAPVAKFAATIGRTLGKIFLPITILMSVFDFVTGFMEGYKEDGIIGGIREGIISVVDGLVGGIIRMVTGAVSFILDLLGFDKFAASITKNVNEALDGLFDSFRGVFDIVKGIFTFDLGLIGDGIGKIFDGIVNVITAPFDMVYGLVQDIFSFVGFELPDFDLGDMITGFISGAYNFVKDKVTGFFSFLGFGGDDEEEELERAKEEERRLRDAGAVSTDGLVTSTSTRNGITDVAASEANIRARGLEVASPEQRAELERLATLRREQAEQALENFRNAPKLSDAIGNVTEKMGAVFSGIGSTVSSGFSVAKNFATDLFTISDQEKEAMSAGLTKLGDIASSGFSSVKNFATGLFSFSDQDSDQQTKLGDIASSGLSSATSFVKNLFTFSEEDASVAGMSTKLLDIVLAPYNIAINFLRGIFGFGEDEQGNVQPFSLGEMLVGVVTDIIDFFKGLFDIDIMGLVRSIPGAGKVLDFFGFGGDEPEVVPDRNQERQDQIALAEMERDDLQRAVDKGGFFQVGRSSEDEIARINQLNEEIARLKMAERQEQVTVVNNNNVVNANTSNSASTTTIAPMRDTTPPPGTVPVYG
jgi:hypothetical protein